MPLVPQPLPSTRAPDTHGADLLGTAPHLGSLLAEPAPHVCYHHFWFHETGSKLDGVGPIPLLSFLIATQWTLLLKRAYHTEDGQVPDLIGVDGTEVPYHVRVALCNRVKSHSSVPETHPKLHFEFF